MKDPWDEDASWAEIAFSWVLQWGGTIFVALILIYLLALLYFWVKPLS